VGSSTLCTGTQKCWFAGADCLYQLVAVSGVQGRPRHKETQIHIAPEEELGWAERRGVCQRRSKKKNVTSLSNLLALLPVDWSEVGLCGALKHKQAHLLCART
jgi:hypothetical protein